MPDAAPSPAESPDVSLAEASSGEVSSPSAPPTELTAPQGSHDPSLTSLGAQRWPKALAAVGLGWCLFTGLYATRQFAALKASSEEALPPGVVQQAHVGVYYRGGISRTDATAVAQTLEKSGCFRQGNFQVDLTQTEHDIDLKLHVSAPTNLELNTLLANEVRSLALHGRTTRAWVVAHSKQSRRSTLLPDYGASKALLLTSKGASKGALFYTPAVPDESARALAAWLPSRLQGLCSVRLDRNKENFELTFISFRTVGAQTFQDVATLLKAPVQGRLTSYDLKERLPKPALAYPIERLDLAHLSILYHGGITTTQAKAVGENLRKTGCFRDGHFEVELAKDKGKVLFAFHISAPVHLDIFTMLASHARSFALGGLPGATLAVVHRGKNLQGLRLPAPPDKRALVLGPKAALYYSNSAGQAKARQLARWVVTKVRGDGFYDLHLTRKDKSYVLICTGFKTVGTAFASQAAKVLGAPVQCVAVESAYHPERREITPVAYP